MLQIIIALLMNFGIISSPADYYDSSPEQQKIYNEIIIEEEVGGV